MIELDHFQVKPMDDHWDLSSSGHFVLLPPLVKWLADNKLSAKFEAIPMKNRDGFYVVLRFKKLSGALLYKLSFS